MKRAGGQELVSSLRVLSNMCLIVRSRAGFDFFHSKYYDSKKIILYGLRTSSVFILIHGFLIILNHRIIVFPNVQDINH